MFRLLAVGVSIAALFAFTAEQADARKAANKKPPEKCQPYGDDMSMCGVVHK